jgi:hypothetical protein
MAVDLIRTSAHFTRAEFPEILHNVQQAVYKWADTLPEPNRSKVKSLIPPIDPRATKHEILGAIDETMPVFAEVKRDLVKYQALLDCTAADNADAKLVKRIADDVAMMFALRTVLDAHWLLQSYAKAVASQMEVDATREMISDLYNRRHLKEIWK